MLGHGAKPDSNYGWAKLMGEVQCQAYHESYGMNVAIVRPFNVYGPRECFDPDKSHVIPALIRKAVLRENPFVVWGNGEQVRAFTYVSDVVDGILLAVEKTFNADPINLGTTEYVTIRQLAEMILQLTNFKTPLTFDETKPTGVIVRRADIRKAKKLLGWEPKVNLEEGLKKTIEWFGQQNPR